MRQHADRVRFQRQSNKVVTVSRNSVAFIQENPSSKDELGATLREQGDDGRRLYGRQLAGRQPPPQWDWGLHQELFNYGDAR